MCSCRDVKAMLLLVRADVRKGLGNVQSMRGESERVVPYQIV